MQMNVRERLNDNRPYWKVIVSLAFSLIGTVLFIYIGLRALVFFMPFVIGWFVSFVVSPFVGWLEKRLKIVKKLSSALIVVLVLAGFIALIYFAVSRLWIEISSLVQNFPDMYEDLESGLREIGGRGGQIFKMLPEGVQNGWNTMIQNLDQTVGNVISRMSEPTVTAAGNFAKGLPSLFISFVVTVISAYFFIVEREDVIVWAKRISPEPVVSRMTMVMDNLKYAVGGYFKAQFKIMAVVFLLLLIGFWILGLHFSILLAIAIAFLDFLPFFGTGTALIPWALYKLLIGDYKMMIGLIIIYAVTQVVRQLIQPKLVGDSMGMNPLFTLVLLFVGYRLGSVLGMIFAVPIGMIAVNLYHAGAFDYILDDVKILVEGVLSLRAKEE